MKNLRNVFALSLLLFGNTLFAQTEIQPNLTVQYGTTPKLHARALTSFGKNIYIGASDGKLYTLNTKNDQITVSNETDGIEYRDIVVNKKNIILLASGDSSKTVSRPITIGKEMYISFDGQFLDGIAFAKNTLFMMGDPIDGKFNLFSSKTGGWSWQQIENAPTAEEGEAGFAASGTNVRMLSETEWLFVSGGNASKLYSTKDAGENWSSISMEFESCASCGAYSFAILPNKTIVAVGGDYTKPDERKGTCRISNDDGKTWHAPTTDLNGYRSNVLYHKGKLFACGSNGIDISYDNGETWELFSKGNYFTMTIFKRKLLASTVNGTIHFFDLKRKK